MDRLPDHPLRAELNDEVHARPPEIVRAPARISYVALMQDEAARLAEVDRLRVIAGRAGVAPPPEGATHFAADLGPFRLKWERHTEFVRYIVVADGIPGVAPFAETALSLVPEEVLGGLPGRIIAAAHAEVAPVGADDLDLEDLSRRCFAGHALVGAEIGEGAGIGLTDFRIHPDGFSRFVVRDRSLTPRQAGRVVQRLFEIDTYKTMALLAFPVARGLVPFLGASEQELAGITRRLAEAQDAEEAALLDRLTRLEAEIERHGAESQFRFGAAGAYYGLVQRRIAELREHRIAGLQTFGEFIERRLAPAMNTCEAAATRQESLSRRVARATQLLSTRVAVTQARQNQELLTSMNRRAHLQLRLQETVEGLSIAAVTYYIVGLVGYAAKGAKPLGVDVNPELAMGISIPVVLVLTGLGIGRIRRIASRARAD